MAPEAQGLGAGRRLLSELIERCTRAGYRQMVAVIGDSENNASVSFHTAIGFRSVGTFRAIGFKFERWVAPSSCSAPWAPAPVPRPTSEAKKKPRIARPKFWEETSKYANIGKKLISPQRSDAAMHNIVPPP